MDGEKEVLDWSEFGLPRQLSAVIYSPDVDDFGRHMIQISVERELRGYKPPISANATKVGEMAPFVLKYVDLRNQREIELVARAAIEVLKIEGTQKFDDETSKVEFVCVQRVAN